MISSNENIWWTNFGNLSEFKSTLLSGCYVFVWDKKRIIYVGTSSDIEKRLHQWRSDGGVLGVITPP